MATIIKNHEGQHSSGAALRGVAYNLADMGVQADVYLNDVRREAAKIVEQAKREAAAVRAQAETAGRKAAEEAIDHVLSDKVSKQMQTLAPALRSAISQIEDAKQDWLRHWEKSASALAIAVAGRIVRSELAKRPELTVEWLREALELAAGSGEVTIRLNPGDYQSLREQAATLAATFAPLGKANVVADATISPAGCCVTTEFGSVDMQLESQLARLAEELDS